MSQKLIDVNKVTRVFTVGEIEVDALRGVNLEVEPGQFCVILGASGSGKTTLLNQIGAIDNPTSGSVKIAGDEISQYDERQKTKYRKSVVGWIFQFHNLIPSLTARENVQLALEMMDDKENQKEKSIEALQSVGLEGMEDRFPAQLSGGQQQRVAIARALVKKPTIIVADEPTGNLDKKTGDTIVELMHQLCREENITFVVVTHDPSMAGKADKVVYMEDGVLYEDASATSVYGRAQLGGK
jgi:putative ABC transport system ATP-binding protein